MIFIKERGYSDDEINELMSKYDMNGDGVLSIEEQSEIREKLQAESENLDKELKDIENEIEQLNDSSVNLNDK